MTDRLLRELGPTLDELAEAVADFDDETVADILGPLDRHDLEALIIGFAARQAPAGTNAERIHAAIVESARIFGTTPGAIHSRSRAPEDNDARAAACYAARLLSISYSEIGRQIGRDHSSVMHACGRVGTTPRLRKAAQRIASGLGWDREDGAA